jgi:hypothetical protein
MTSSGASPPTSSRPSTPPSAPPALRPTRAPRAACGGWSTRCSRPRRPRRRRTRWRTRWALPRRRAAGQGRWRGSSRASGRGRCGRCGAVASVALFVWAGRAACAEWCCTSVQMGGGLGGGWFSCL